MFEITLANWPPVSRLLAENVSEWFMLFGVLHKLAIGFAVVSVVSRLKKFTMIKRFSSCSHISAWSALYKDLSLGCYASPSSLGKLAISSNIYLCGQVRKSPLPIAWVFLRQPPRGWVWGSSWGVWFWDHLRSLESGCSRCARMCFWHHLCGAEGCGAP